MQKTTLYKKLLVNISLSITGVIWGSTFFVQKDALRFVDPMTLNGCRALLGAIVLGLLLLLFKKNPFANFKAGIAVGLLYSAGFTAQTVGLNSTSAFNSGFITGLFVLFVPLFSFLFWRAKLGLEKILALLIAMIGLWFATGGIHTFNGGDFLNLLGAVFWGLYVLQADKALKNKSEPFSLNFQQMVILGVLSFATVLIFRLPVTISSGRVINIILYLAIVANVIAYSLQFIAQKYASPVNVAMLLLLEPVFAGIFAWTLGGENFAWTKFAGGLLIIIGIVFSELKVFNRSSDQ